MHVFNTEAGVCGIEEAKEAADEFEGCNGPCISSWRAMGNPCLGTDHLQSAGHSEGSGIQRLGRRLHVRS